jgi:hypothetical protein
LGVLARLCKSKFWEILIDRLLFDRSTSGKIQSINFKFDRSSSIFQAIPHEFCHSSLIKLQNIKTQKLTKASENNKAKGLTYVNQGVQIHNIWHSSFNRPDISLHGSYDQASYMEIACTSSTVRTLAFKVQTLQALLW